MAFLDEAWRDIPGAMPKFDATWNALAREAQTAAEHIAIGVTALGRANYAQPAYYTQAFFALSVGFERSAKLAIATDYAVENRGKFPEPKALTGYGHDLAALLKEVDRLGARRGLPTLPSTPIHAGIVATLTQFSDNVTRYYHLDVLTKGRGVKGEDPISRWYDIVTVPVLELHCRTHHRNRIRRQAGVVAAVLPGIVRKVREDGTPFASVAEASERTGLTEFSRPFVRMYVLQFARCFSAFFRDVQYRALHARLDQIPFLGEFFAIYNNEDDFFKRRKSWSIYTT